MVELCREYGISRKTGYKWLARFEETGIDGLVDESRRPLRSPAQAGNSLVVEVVKLREAHPTWGPRKIRVLMAKRMAGAELPSSRTIARILDRSNLPKKKRRYKRASKGLPTLAPKWEVTRANDLWTVDFKGWWRAKDGRRCDPLTIRDAFSRKVLALRLVERTRTAEVRRVFMELFEECGLPRAIQSDNGPPFASVRAAGGLTQLSAWWVSLGIEVVRSRPGHPQDNGAHERMHGDLRAEVQARASANVQDQQEACDVWRVEFNHVRPHEALGMRTPAELYQPSSRRLADAVRAVELRTPPAGMEVRFVSRSGTVKHDGKSVYVSTALARQPVDFETLPTRVRVWFYHRLLGEYSLAAFHRQPAIAVEPIKEENSLTEPADESAGPPSVTG